jgi:hypothetical protein
MQLAQTGKINKTEYLSKVRDINLKLEEQL